jgi:CBS domain-containing protein
MRSKTTTCPQPNDPPITCSPTTCLQEVVKMITSHHVHRVWVTQGTTLKGVVSLSDILRKVAGV